MGETDLAEATKTVLATGRRVFQIFKLGTTEREHLERLLALCWFPHNAKILDMGCGVGEVAKVFKGLRPDLNFILLNNNAYQLTQCPDDFDQAFCDMHHTHFTDHSFDGVMLNYALGYGRPERLFREIERILKSKGVLFIADLWGDKNIAKNILHYRIYDKDELLDLCPLKPDLVFQPTDGFTSDIDGLEDVETIKTILMNLAPIFYRFHKA